jgi:hypothetical protein
LVVKIENGRTSDISLLGPSQITLRDENITRQKHSKTTEFLRRVKDDRQEAGGHLAVQADP